MPHRPDPNRFAIGRFWLWYRADRDEWCICWLDGRVVRRRGTGVGGGSPADPPDDARRALARHAFDHDEPVRQAPAQALVANIFADWLRLHVAKLSDTARYAYSVDHWLRFFAAERSARRLAGSPTVADINRALCDRFIAWRTSAGAAGNTISRDMAALRSALGWAWKHERIASVPFVPDVEARQKAGPRDLVLTQEQVAAVLEAAYATPERRHVHLYMLIQLSTHGRSKAILELDADEQIRDGLIHFNAPGRRQTSKRRAVVPIAPTLAPWLAGASGRVIRYRAPIAEKRWSDPAVPEWFERTAWDIDNAFAGCCIAAHHARPDLGLAAPALDDAGAPIMLPPRAKLGETSPRPKLAAVATPNTLRHTLNTELHARGVPEAQIETAAGHRGEGTNKRNYRHLRPDYLREFIAAVEDYWREMDRLTTVHRHPSARNVVALRRA